MAVWIDDGGRVAWFLSEKHASSLRVRSLLCWTTILADEPTITTFNFQHVHIYP